MDMQLTHKGKSYQSTFLPEVAQEEGWDQRMTLLELLFKDDFPVKEIENNVDLDKIIKKMKITTYESVKTELTYRGFKSLIKQTK